MAYLEEGRIRKFSGNVEAMEVPLKLGLSLVCKKGLRLYSDGLEPNEYMFYKGDGIYYEDNCFIGKDDSNSCERLLQLEWVLNHRFFISKELHSSLYKLGV